jgi:hypothetical protein
MAIPFFVDNVTNKEKSAINFTNYYAREMPLLEIYMTTSI